MSLTDTHAHLADERILPDVDAVVERARAAGVTTIVCIATDADDSRTALALAERLPGVYATAGVHPHAALRATDEAFATIAELIAHPRVVALGETGLDYHYDFAPRDRQIASFTRHLELAATSGLPVVVHAREADDDVRALIREHAGRARGVLHCFAGAREMLDDALTADWYVSFSGMITFKKYDGADLVRAVPADRILVETDTPYLAPVPFRGKPNEPAHVRFTAARAAEMRGVDVDAFAAQTTANARTFYGLPEE
ncbi:MAG TPA: TatD family hydrolase [Longimicrobiaceae bacterium]|nr:TatD family hydrolase [Longimicrobiaceae bacterium]